MSTLLFCDNIKRGGRAPNQIEMGAFHLRYLTVQELPSHI